ncbi:MAG: acyl carrier protein [Parvibaculaceae bacterium]|nr:acyl carrier protein [Parvibaculaceae bacterium]
MDVELETIIKIITGQYEGRERVTPDTVYSALHIDPLDAPEIMINLEEALDVEVTEEDYESCRTVNDLYVRLSGKKVAA